MALRFAHLSSALVGDLTRADLVQMFGISLSTLKRYVKQRREKGHMQPKAIPGRLSKKRAQVESSVLPQLQAHNEATLDQHCHLWEQTHGERVSRWTISRVIKWLGWTRKKVHRGNGAQRGGTCCLA
jgi:transposase